MIESGEVKLHFLDYWRVVRVRLGLITLVFLLVMVTAGVTVYFMPRKYLANVTMEVRPDNYKPVDMFSGVMGHSYDPQFVSTQFQILREPTILDPVIDQLDLIKAFSKDGPLLPRQIVEGMLNASMETEEVRNTAMIRIKVLHTDKKMAANIANTIAVVYQKLRMDDLSADMQRGMGQFKDIVEDQRTKVVKEASLAAQMRLENGINDPDPESSAAILTELDKDLAGADVAVNEQRTHVSVEKSKLARINELKPEQLMEAMHGMGLQEDTVSKQIPALQENESQEANLLKNGLGENHKAIQALRAVNAVIRKNLGEALERVRHAQVTELKLAEETLTNLEERQRAAKEAAIASKQKISEYTKVKTEYLEDKHILETAEMQYAAKRMEKGIDINPARIYRHAEEPLWPSEPKVARWMIVAAACGLLLGVGLAFFIEYLDTSVKSLDDVERFLQSPVLAVIPKGVPILMRYKGEHPDAEAYRILRANIEFNKPSPDAKTLTLISAGPGEGKSTTLNNLAFTCAKGGYNVLVVDADLRRPSQHVLFETDNDRGLTDHLMGRASLDAITRTTKIDNLSFISSGQFPADNVGLLNSQRMTDLIQRVRSQYDLVLFDSPPILGVSDGSVLASEMDMTVMVVQHRRFPRAMLQRVKQAVNQVGGALAGVVLNNVDKAHDEGYTYYNAYNSYYAVPDTKETRTTTASPSPRKPAAVAPAHKDNGHDDY